MWRGFVKRMVSRRMAFFLVPWLIILVIPALRDVFRLQIRGHAFGGEWQFPWESGRENSEESNPFSTRNLQRKYPNNVDVQVLAAQTSNLDNSNYPDVPMLDAPTPKLDNTMALDRLISNHPDKAWIVAIRARTGPAESAARRGQQLEPENVFFDWMLMRELINSGREEEALKVLDRAASKQHYNNHARDLIASRFAAYSLVRRLTIEEKGAVAFDANSSMQVPRSPLPQLVMVRARHARQQGKHQQALEYYGKLMRLYATMRREEDRLYLEEPYEYDFGRDGFFDAEKAELELWVRAADADPQTLMKNKSGTAHYLTLISSNAKGFAAYARRHGSPGLADLFELEAAAVNGSELRRLSFQYGSWFQAHVVPVEVQNRIWSLFLLACGCGASLAFLVFVRMLLALPLWTPGLRSEPLQASDARLTLLAYGLGAGGVLTLGLWPRMFDTEPTAAMASMVVCSYLPAMMLLSALLSSMVTLARHRGKIFRPASPEPGLRGAHVPRNWLPAFVTAISWVVLFITSVCWIATAYVYSLPSGQFALPLPPMLQTPASGAIALLDWSNLLAIATWLTAACYFGWLLRWRWTAPHDLKPVAHYAVRWHLISLGDLAIVLSFAHLAILIAALPVRGAADVALDRFLASGSVTATVAASDNK